MYYLTKAGVKLVNEDRPVQTSIGHWGLRTGVSRKEIDQSNARDFQALNRQRTWSATNRPSTRAVQTPSERTGERRGRGGTHRGLSSDSPGHIQRMYDHIKRMAKDQPPVRYTMSKG